MGILTSQMMAGFLFFLFFYECFFVHYQVIIDIRKVLLGLSNDPVERAVIRKLLIIGEILRAIVRDNLNEKTRVEYCLSLHVC